MTSAGWKPAPHIRVVRDGSSSYVVSGCKGSPDDQGASSSYLDNGAYSVQPASEKVNGQLQYVLKTPGLQGRDEQRHLIYSITGDCWKITPTCGEEEGSYLSQETGNIDPTKGVWRTVPADVQDTVRFSSSDDKKQQRQQSKTPPPPSTQQAEEEGDDDEQREQDDSADQLSNLVPWNLRNHESLLFSNKTSTLAFFSARPDKLKSRMNPALVRFLELNKIVVGEDLHSATTDKYHRLLCALTNVQRNAQESSQLLGGRFAITGDALLKFLAIVMRLRCGIPVVLLGECGCGKTYSIKFLAAFLQLKLFSLDVHGGTSEQDVLSCIQAAEIFARQEDQQVMVFLDEVNACAHLGLIEEVLIQRSAFGKRVDDRILFLAALNPYREIPPSDLVGAEQDAGGLVLYDRPLKHKNLVYLVHPVPSALVHVAFDFGALKPQEERYYIQSMCQSTLGDAAQDGLSVVAAAMTSKEITNLVVDWICASQAFVREKERNDPSAASLRDAQRCLSLMVWFLRLADKRPTTVARPFVATANCALLGLAFAYMFRLASRKLRSRFWDNVRSATERTHPSFAAYKRDGGCESVLASTQRAFCSRFELEPGIAMNEALSENLFLSVVCILNRIPLFLVGKPGTSKTLALQIAASNLLGKNSPVKFWRRFPALAMFTYQCSPLSTAQEIRKQFDTACRFQTHSTEQISVFVMDEVGLAEFSPSLPLKVLHSILVDPPVAVVGVSNWTLDRAKMNRAILLTRPEPSVYDLRFTGDKISKSFKSSGNTGTSEEDGEPSVQQQQLEEAGEEWWLKGLADTFYDLYSTERQSGREFWGMRDYYALVRQLKHASDKLDKPTLVTALCRNLGGKPDRLEAIVEKFVNAVFPNTTSSAA